ncbi:MAG: discoidin domain-containing protein, partial [Planctomycetota bacterium]|nr:discoidin domain-containing protein [Planctomycetota bacterium]
PAQRHSFAPPLTPPPQWLEVDLEKVFTLGEIDLYTYFGDGRYYQYVIEVSTDEKTWTKVADGSANTAPATAKGYRHAISPTKARYIRTTMLKNSANQGQHVVELRAYEAK